MVLPNWGIYTALNSYYIRLLSAQTKRSEAEIAIRELNNGVNNEVPG